MSLILTTGLWAQIPAWRDASPATRFLGPDRFWRCRDTLIFAMHNETGQAFHIDLDVRDMNTYLQGPRPVLISVADPQGCIVVHQVLEDDGVVAGDQPHHDGVPDMYGDIRYRAWHRHNSPGGYPPGKSRSPLLADPGQLEARRVTLSIPAAGPGLYRLMIVGTWDNWISVTPDRPLPTAINPGPAPLYMHGDQLDKSWLYAPANVQDIGISISEEVQPFSWSANVLDESGNDVAAIKPKGPYNFAFVRGAKPDSLYQLDLTPGSPGACLHIGGIPMLLCPDKATARLFKGNMQIDAKGRVTWHGFQRTLNAWCDSLMPDALQVTAPEPADPTVVVPGPSKVQLGDVAKLLAAQNLDPSNDAFGEFSKTGDERLDKMINPFWKPEVMLLSEVAGWNDPANPYYGNPAMVRRIMLYLAKKRFSTQNAYYWYTDVEKPRTYAEKPEKFWDLALRSNWYPLLDGNFTLMLGPIRNAMKYALPPAVNDAWRQSVQDWAIGRTVMQQGECTNQWGLGLKFLVDIWDATRDYDIQQVMARQIDYFTTPGVLGRVNPDPDLWCEKSSVGYGWAADSGLIGAAIPAENFGHDNEYALESVSHLSYIHAHLPNPKIIDWLNDYYILKTHLTMPKSGGWPKGSFTDTASPSDSNHRTRYYTHKSGLEGAENVVNYGDIWAGEKNAEHPWPCLEKKPFIRSLDNRYHFLNTGNYYAILYTGPAAPFYPNWGTVKMGDGTVDWVGYSGMHYGGFGYKPTKLSAISGLWIPGCGPVISAQNHNVMYTLNVWARLKQPICEDWEKGHTDATVIAEGMNQPLASFEADTRSLKRETSFFYAPLTVRRSATFGDNDITMTVEIEATDDLELVEAYEAIPVYTQDRTVTLLDGDLKAIPYELPEAITTPTNGPGIIPVEQRGPMPEAPEVTARVIDIAGESGAGAAIVFDQAYTFTQTQPIRYRAVAAATGGFNLKLPVTWKKGQVVTLKYRILPHSQAFSADDLK